MTTVGAHTVGARDGSPGVPLTGWSRDYGDLRVPHFIGLHGLQALAIAAVFLRRWRRPEAVRVRAMLVITASYASLFGLLLWQALQGESFVAPDPMTLALMGAWAAITALALGLIALAPRPRTRWDPASANASRLESLVGLGAARWSAEAGEQRRRQRSATPRAKEKVVEPQSP